MSGYIGAICDDFYVSGRLFLRLDMELERETVLHFFDRIRREYPRLTRLRRRETGGLVLEEDVADDGARRWVRLDPGALRFGHYGPEQLEPVEQFGALILSQAPFHLTFSEIDFDHLELVFAFDLLYRGNHDELVAETLFGPQSAAAFLFSPQGTHIIEAQPYFGIALNEACDLQAYIEVKSRTNTFEVSTQNYEAQPITVFLTIRKYWKPTEDESLERVLSTLFEVAGDLATERVVPLLVNPLAAAIASRS